MARKKMSPVWQEPSPQEHAAMAMENAAHHAAMAHPQTVRLKKMLLAEMHKAAKAPGGSAKPTKKKPA